MANEEIDEIQDEISQKIVEGLKDPARSENEDLSLKNHIEARVNRSPMRALKWCRDKTNFYFEVYIELTESEGVQGLRVFRKSDDKLMRDLQVPMRSNPKSGKVETIIFHNNKAIIALLVKQIIDKNNNLDDLEAAIIAEIVTGKGNPIGTSATNLSGVAPKDCGFMRSPCTIIKWLNDNSPYVFRSFAKLTDTGGSQGLMVYSQETGDLVREVSVPIGGGLKANPKKDIYKNNRKILLKAVDRIWNKIQNGGF